MCVQSPGARIAAAGRAEKGNAVRGPFNAAFFTVMDGYLNFILRRQKARVFADMPEEIVELGAGVGANFKHMRAGTRVIAVEPNPHMHKGLRRRAKAAGVELSILATGGERIDLPDASVDAVACTLVMCTVDDPVSVLREIRRILRPGGRFLFVEHVAAPAGSWRHRLQNLVHRPWHWVFEGCNTNRRTAEAIEAAGFSRVDIQASKMVSPFIPVNTVISGVATA